MSHIRLLLVGVVLGAVALGTGAMVAAQEKTRVKEPPPKTDDVRGVVEKVLEKVFDAPAKKAETPKPPLPPTSGAVPSKAETPSKAGTSSAVPSKAESSSPPKSASSGEKVLRVHLMEGSVVSGKLSVNSIMVETEFGKLEVPVTRIVSFTPGLDSHPKEREDLRRLVLQLGANDKATRDDAEKQLSARGAAIKPLLEEFRDDKDTERRNRVTKIMEEIDQQSEEDDGTKATPLIDEDTITTTSFTMVGKISPQSFQVHTKFGPLTVNLADIRRAEHESSDEKQPYQKTIDVAGNNLVMRNWLNSNIKVNKGDKIIIEASGQIVMSPWGSESVSGPEGSQNYGQYKPGIYGGALVLRWGPNGQEELVGRHKTFTATKSTTLHFGVAMQPNFTSSGYQFPGNYKVKVKVNPQ